MKDLGLLLFGLGMCLYAVFTMWVLLDGPEVLKSWIKEKKDAIVQRKNDSQDSD